MTHEDYKLAQAFLEAKSTGLMKHEAKPIAKTGFPMQSYTVYTIKGRTFYVAATNTFRAIMIDGIFVEALKEHPEKFGTGEAYDVIEALRLIEPSFDTAERHAQFLQNEQFCFIMENKSGVIKDHVLRIDLFRHIKPSDSLINEFVGGIFHAFKHFSYKGVNLSTGKDVNDIQHPERIIGLAIQAFYMPEEIEQTSTGFVGRISLDEKYWLKFVFYFEEVNGVHFINSIHKEEKNIL